MRLAAEREVVKAIRILDDLASHLADIEADLTDNPLIFDGVFVLADKIRTALVTAQFQLERITA